jgi:hypothetical protein
MVFEAWKRGAATAVASLLFAFAAPAQNVGPGLIWSGSFGTVAGSFRPSCTPDSMALFAGETVTLTVWGDFRAPFGLFAAPSSTPCVMFPGVGGGLVLGAPVVPVSAGVLSQISPCLACPEAFADVTFTVPPGLPSGVTIAFQALTFGGTKPAFTVGIVATS